MKTLRNIVAATMCLAASLRAGAQDIHMSQFYETPILRNPALIGIFNGDVRVQAVYRNQWNSMTTAYQTGTLSGELKFPVGQYYDYVTTGLQMSFDRAGESQLQSVQALPAVNYHKSLSADKSSYLSLGVMGGFVQRQFDPTHLTFNNQYTNGRFDAAAPTGEEGRLTKQGYTYFDAGVGLSYNSTIGEDVPYYIGAALYHLTSPKVSFYGDKGVELAKKWSFNAGITIPLDEKFRMIAQYNQMHQGTYNEYIGGALIGYSLYDEGLESDHGIYGGMFFR
ncbi:PorP/SprF family type IX secretion system membrane protein [Chitinophaga sedimenti]|uniref:PorP/SprF family type IX secretion system membrane protein n=1 Tax=Chitinophaga sedimenti TaxID=2033606 RepID=UPI00200405E4|nr:PorP/SprF family type IX secretion system membrane protein [Chitinophaga sedimenti]MCK7559729.1 PorP/SprF family type IX secretion system membrane protein [Chitinophaga sedimenti]